MMQEGSHHVDISHHHMQHDVKDDMQHIQHVGMEDGEVGNAHVSSTIQLDGWALDEDAKNQIIELQRHWLEDFRYSREKLLVEMTEKLHQEFLSDQQKIRTDLLTQFKDELDTTRMELESKYNETLKQELAKVQDKHKREISNAKHKQWCWQCDNEAIYHCCWNTSYCSVECQQSHWGVHRKFCRRKKGNNPAGPNAAPSGLTSSAAGSSR